MNSARPGAPPHRRLRALRRCATPRNTTRNRSGRPDVGEAMARPSAARRRTNPAPPYGPSSESSPRGPHVRPRAHPGGHRDGEQGAPPAANEQGVAGSPGPARHDTAVHSTPESDSSSAAAPPAVLGHAGALVGLAQEAQQSGAAAQRLRRLRPRVAEGALSSSRGGVARAWQGVAHQGADEAPSALSSPSPRCTGPPGCNKHRKHCGRLPPLIRSAPSPH